MLFTQTRINALKCPPGQRDAILKDKGQRGLAIRVLASGSKSYRAEWVEQGKKHTIPLGSYDAISLAQARAAVQAIMGDRARGINPMTAREQARTLTLGELLEDWRTLHLNGRRLGYATEAFATLRRTFGAYLAAPAEGLGRTAIVGALDRMSREGHASMAKQTAAYGRAAYGWALKRGAIKTNPFTALPVTSTVRRERTLDDIELAKVWRVTDSSGMFDRIVRLLILTGQRRDEVGNMAWPELSDDLSTWELPAGRAKNGRAHVVPLADPARQILRAIPRTDDLVFSCGRGAFGGFSRFKLALDKKSGVTDWRLHDLRRTMATGLQRLGVRLEVTESVLNHVGGSRGGIVSIYQRHDYATEKRAALESWAAHVMAVVEGRALDPNVTAIRAGGHR